MAQWTEQWPENQKVAGLIPAQGICLGCGPGPRVAGWGQERQPIDVSLSLSPSLPLPENT